MEMGSLSITQDLLVSALLQSEDEIIYGIHALYNTSCHHDGDDYTDLKIWRLSSQKAWLQISKQMGITVLMGLTETAGGEKIVS